MFAVVVHNSDEVKDVFTGQDKDQILGKLKESTYWADIVDRIEGGFIPISDEDDEEGKEFNENNITLDDVTELYHDGDSEDGFTLLDTI